MSRDDCSATPDRAGGVAPWPSGSAAVQHLGLLVAACSVVVIAIRLLSISGYSPTTAAAVLDSQGTGSVAVGSLIDFWPLLSLATLAFVLHVRRVPRVASSRTTTRVMALLALCWVVFLVPAPFTAAVIIASLVAWMIRRWRRIERHPDRRGLGLETLVAAVLLLVAMGVAVNPTPWLPAERLVRTDERDPIVGYVLDADRSSLVVLMEEPRTVVRVPADTVVERDFCRVGAGWLLNRLPDRWRTLAPPYGLVLMGASPPEYPDCS